MAIAWRPSYRKRELLKDLDDQEIERLWSGVDVKGYGLTERDAEWEHCRRTCGKEDISTPMTAPDTQPQDTQSAAALWWEALQVMGYVPGARPWPRCVGIYVNGKIAVTKQESENIGPIFRMDHDLEWQLFGLAVEWIEARGGKTLHHTPFQPDMSGLPIAFGVSHSRLQPHTQYARGRTLPTAAARWIKEHGPKIAGKGVNDGHH